MQDNIFLYNDWNLLHGILCDIFVEKQIQIRTYQKVLDVRETMSE
jgi:hypothetical protein